MKELFDRVSRKTSKNITNTYSTSFSLGIYFLAGRFHRPVNGIYGFVRLADEIVDSFHGYDKAYLLQKLRLDVREAIDQRISLNPVLNSFQQAVNDYHIEWELIACFLKSMEMDLSRTKHNRSTYEDYILGSAEVVGLMCLRVFTEGDQELYERLKPAAKKLGAAFQKVNFLRDVQADFEDLGRTYFPGINMQTFRMEDKLRIEQEIAADFREALEGIRRLPGGARKGVYLAYFYYQRLFQKIKKLQANQILKERIRIPNGQKFGLMLHSLVRHQLNLL